jgi:hypothetical protein
MLHTSLLIQWLLTGWCPPAPWSGCRCRLWWSPVVKPSATLQVFSEVPHLSNVRNDVCPLTFFTVQPPTIAKQFLLLLQLLNC